MGIGNDLIGELEELLVRRVVRSQQVFRFSRPDSFAHRFERAVGRMYDGCRVLLLPSASIGFQSLIEALGLREGDEVALAPFGWVANFSIIKRRGLAARFVPLNSNLELTPAAVRSVITEKTKVLLVAHLMGRAQPHIKEIAALCQQRNILLIEDISQAFGVRVGAALAGTFGTAAYSSFNHHKILSTGDGGMVLTADQSLMDRLFALHDQGCVIEAGRRQVPEHPGPGCSLRVNELTAAMALAQLTRFFLIMTLIWKRYREVEKIVSAIGGIHLISPGEGDLPYTCLFRLESDHQPKNYPSLAASGWHSVENIPYLAVQLKEAMENDAAITKSFIHLSRVYSVGSGFIDKYFATPIGLTLRKQPQETEKLRKQLEEHFETVLHRFGS
jgi:dTDP-4-amino-4,6-dideoxygalactose transaminase